MLTATLLSVLTPVYNGASYIEACLKNVASQNCSEIEHIIVDGASTDETFSIIQEYTVKYSHIKVISAPDYGQSDAMNKAVQFASSPYISFLNVDDKYESNTLIRMVQLIKGVKKFDFAVGNCKVWDDKKNLLYLNQPKYISKFNLLRDHQIAVNPCAYFYKKELHDHLGYYDINNHSTMDIDWLIRVSFYTNFFYIDEIWGNFHMVVGSKTKGSSEAGILQSKKHLLFERYIHQLTIMERIRFEWFRLIDFRKWKGIKEKTFDVVIGKIEYEWTKKISKRNG